MKILCITTRFSQKVSGISRADQFVFRELQKFAECDLVFVEPLRVPRIVINIGRLFFKKDVQGFFNNIPFIVKVKNLHKYDVVYFLNQRNTLALNWIKTDNVVVCVHDVVFYSTGEGKGQSYLLQLYEHLCFRGIRRARMIVADSESEKENISRYLGYSCERIETVYLGIDPVEFYDKKPGPAKTPSCFDVKHKTVLSVGTECPRKNVPTLVKALANVHKEMPNLRLVRIGVSLYEQEHKRVQELIASLQLQDAVTFLGYVDEPLNNYYHAADVFVMPSVMEGFGFPLLEAMACGCPVIVSRRSSLPELGGNAVLYLENPYDSEELARKIKLVLKDKVLRKKMIKNGLTQAAKFSWAKTGERLRTVLERVVMWRV